MRRAMYRPPGQQSRPIRPLIATTARPPLQRVRVDQAPAAAHAPRVPAQPSVISPCAKPGLCICSTSRLKELRELSCQLRCQCCLGRDLQPSL
eukprot:918917-Amphidinium_carterae.1